MPPTRTLLLVLSLLLPCGAPALDPTGAPTSREGRDATHWVVGIGSSSMFGAGAAVAPFVNVLVDALGSPPWLVRNEGVPGIHSGECLHRWRTLARGRGFGSLVLMCGLNDIRHGRSAADTWASLRALLDEATSDGLRVIPLTLQPFKGDPAWTPGKHRQLLALNAAIRAYCEEKHLVGVDAYALLNDPANDGALQVRFDSGDHLHFSQAAHDLLGREARATFP